MDANYITKENWEVFSKLYPKTFKHFNEWFENYKIENDWNKLFNGKRITGSGKLTRSPEYYELPIALQFGIFIQYTATINVNGFYTNSIGINNPKHSIEFQIKKLEQNL